MKWKNRIDMIGSFGPGCVCAEVGVFRGEFSREIVKFNPAHLFLVDCWQRQEGDYEADTTNREDLYLAYRNVSDHFLMDSRVAVMRKFSVDAVKEFPDGTFDWAYLDADHTWLGITRDIHLWWPKVKSGGWLCGHDYGNCCPPAIVVKPVVDAFAVVHRCEVQSTEHVPPYDTSWAIRKP